MNPGLKETFSDALREASQVERYVQETNIFVSGPDEV